MAGEENESKKLSKKAKFFSKLKRRFLKHIWLARLTVLVAIIGVAYLFIFLIGLALKNTTLAKYFEIAKSFAFAPKGKIETIENRTNILILGKAGEGHDSPDLTDTVIFASVSHSDPNIVLVSLPRDIWIADLRAKLNSAYYWGNQKQEGGGLILAKSTVEQIVGNPVQYGLVVDFSSLVKIIDTLGGVEVGVERSFVDEHYPIAGRENDECDGDPEFKCRYETIRFEAGSQLMNGETALKFVRSRNAEGDEGTDLARAARQQKVLSAIRKKLLSPEILLNPKKALSVWQVVKESVETDIEGPAGAILARRVLEARGATESHVLSEDFLVNPNKSARYDNQYVFVPKADDWNEVHEWIDSLLK